jgi:hypothetical protein
METDRPPAPAAGNTAQPRRGWISPAVVDLGGIRELTLLQGGSGGGVCDPLAGPSCP